MSNIDELKLRAIGIKEEVNEGANTANRVGGLLYDIIDSMGGSGVQPDWNQDDSTQLDFIKNKPNIPSTAGLASEQYVRNYTYDRQTIDDKVAQGGTFDPTNYYTKREIDFINTTQDNEIAIKANKSEMSIIEGASGSPTEGKATITLKQGTSVNVLIKHQDISGKANTTDVYPKTETYNKNELNNMITTPDQEYVTVTATAQTTTVTDVLPATGSADTIYRVGNWNGSQYDETVYSEYAWNGSIYLLLSVKDGSQPIKDAPNNWGSSYNSDLSFVDANGYSIVDFMNGHVHTKNFNSADAPIIVNPSEGSFDFGITDAGENAIVIFENGHIRTKNFNSAELVNGNYFRYKGKKISILGDSISTWGDTDSRNQLGTYCYSYYPTETCRYSKNGNVTIDGVTYQSIKMAVKDTWWMHLINNLGAVLGCNESYRGTLVTGSGSTTFNNQTRINHLGSNGTPDVILVYGGTNDAGNSATLGTFNGGVYSDYDTAAKIAALDVSTFANAYKAMLIRLMYTYPDAEIVCILPTFTTSYYTISTLDSYVEVIKEACDFFGIKWIDVRVSGISIFNKGNYLVDGIHPNAQGMQLLSNKIYKQLIFS